MPEVIPYDPLLTFKFRLFFADGGDQPIAGISKMGALKQKTEATAWRAAGHLKNAASQISGGTSYEPVTFEQGLGLDDGRFEKWALACSTWKEGAGGRQSPGFRRDLRVEVLDLQGKAQLKFVMNGAWVSEYQALPELDANNMNTVGIASFTVVYEGWYRQT
jgi:phage tail-like protein